MLTSCSSTFDFKHSKAANESLESLDFFVGEWSCHSQWEQGQPDKKSVPYSNVKQKVQWSLEGQWLTMKTVTVDKNTKHLQNCSLSFDSEKSFYKQLCIGNYEGWSHWDSTGWTENRLEFTGTSQFNGLSLSAAQSFYKTGENSYELHVAYQGVDQGKDAQAQKKVFCQRAKKTSTSERHQELMNRRK